MAEDPRRLIARLAIAVMAADRRVGPNELAALEGLGERELPALGQLERLGLGALAELAWAEAQRAEREPIDVVATCAALRASRTAAASTVMAALAEVASADGTLAEPELEVLDTIGRELGLPARAARRIIAGAVAGDGGYQGDERARARPTAAELEHALQVLGVAAGAGSAAVETAYRQLVERFDPAKFLALGGEFAAEATRTLARVTDAYETARAALAADA